VTGLTNSDNFPLEAASQISRAGDVDAFVAVLNPSGGSTLFFSTYLGGTGHDMGYGIAVDGSGNVYVTGHTYSSGLATSGAFQTSYGGRRDAFVTQLHKVGEPDSIVIIDYVTYLGGSDTDTALGIAVDGSGYRM